MSSDSVAKEIEALAGRRAGPNQTVVVTVDGAQLHAIAARVRGLGAGAEGRCGECGTKIINDCATCGAPQCCPLCCSRDECARLRADRAAPPSPDAEAVAAELDALVAACEPTRIGPEAIHYAGSVHPGKLVDIAARIRRLAPPRAGDAGAQLMLGALHAIKDRAHRTADDEPGDIGRAWAQCSDLLGDIEEIAAAAISAAAGKEGR